MIYLIISLVLIGITVGCLKSKFNLSLIPVCVMCFLLSSILSTILYTVEFWKGEKIEKVIVDVDIGKFKIIDEFLFGRKLKFKKEDGGGFYDLEDTIKVVKDSVTFLKTIDYQIVHKTDILMPGDISFSKKNLEKELHLNPEDYGVYKAYKDSLEKRNKSLEKNGKNV